MLDVPACTRAGPDGCRGPCHLDHPATLQLHWRMTSSDPRVFKGVGPGMTSNDLKAFSVDEMG